MITTVNYAPSYLQGAYNPIIWSVLSNKVGEIDFKFVFDIYKDNVKIIRLKQRANPAGAGMIDISTITQGYLLVNEPNSPILQGETTIEWLNNNHIYADNGTLSAHFTAKVGEEYTTGGVTTMYNGVTNQPGEPAYALNAGTLVTGVIMPVHVWPSSVPTRQQQWAMSNYSTLSGAYGEDPATGRVYDHGYAQLLAGDHLAYPLSMNKLEQDVYATDKMVLSWINWSPYPSFPRRIIYGFRYKWYNAAGTLVRTDDAPCITQWGYAARATCSSLIDPQLAAKYDLIHVLASPNDAAYALSDGLFTAPAGGRLEIQGYDAGIGVCIFGNPITEKVTLNIQEECEPALYARVRLSWLNELGGRDYMAFTMLTEKTTDVTQSTYSQEQMQWSSLKPVQTGVSDPIRNLGIAGGDKIYNKSAKTSWKIMTDWLDQEQAALLESLVKSPQVIAYIHEGNTASVNPGFGNEFAYTVNVKQTSYTTKNVRQTKLVQGEFNIEVALQQKMQNT